MLFLRSNSTRRIRSLLTAATTSCNPVLKFRPSNNNGIESYTINTAAAASAQRRFLGYSTNKSRPRVKHGEEHFIAQMLRWLAANNPKIVIHVERLQFTGCGNFLPDLVWMTLQECQMQIKCLTHADLLSDAALTHQIHLAEHEGRNRDGSPIAVFALALSPETKTKAVKQLQMGIYGATRHVNDRKAVVTGLPNSGKSSLILPLTKERTMNVRKKKAYHLPKVSMTAGRTLGMKTHVFEPHKRYSISLMDSPGLRPKLEDTTTQGIALLLAAKMVEPFKNHKKLVGETTVCNMLLSALNRHAALSGDPDMLPEYVARLGMDGPTTDGATFLQAIRDYERKNKRRNRPIDEINLIRQCHEGEYGGMVFGNGPIIRDLPRLKFNRNYTKNAIVYMNEQAKRLVYMGNAQPPPLKKKKQAGGANQDGGDGSTA